MHKPIKKTSPSQIKTFGACSWLYYSKYFLKIPDKGNLGNRLGDAVHRVAEIVIKDKYKPIISKIINTSIFPKSFDRLLTKYLKEGEFYSLENVEKCKQYLLVAFKNDFYCDGYEIIGSEVEFTIEKQYKIGGYIDVLAKKKLPNGKYATKIIDYKTQSKLFTDKELQFNLQAYTYLLAALDRIPEMDILESEVQFVMLQHPDNPIQKFKLSSLTELESYEEYLTYIQKNIDNFTEKNKESYLANDMGFPTKEEGFCKNLLCGRATFPGELKKDGSPKFYCPAKFGFNYFVGFDNAGKIKYSSFEESGIPQKDGITKEERVYSGCPAFNSKNRKTKLR